MQILRFAAVFVLSTAALFAQVQPPLPSSGPVEPQLGTERKEQDPALQRMEHQRLKALNKDRQDSLKKDTDKLLRLATELKEAVDKSSQETLSLEVLRKTEEIEKLSKSIRDKMKDAY